MEEHGIEVKAVIDARKERIAADAALELALAASTLRVAKGKQLLEFKLRGGKLLNSPGGSAAEKREELRKAIIGPSGNLRAPTLFVGKTLYVGFSEDLYAGLEA